MSTPQQVSATLTGVRAQDEFFGSSSEPGSGPVERSRASAVLHWPEYAMEGVLLGFSAAVNPAITIIANALRVGDHLLQRLSSATVAETQLTEEAV